MARAAARTLTVWGRTSSSNTQKVLWILQELRLAHELVPASARLGATSEYLVGEHCNSPAFGVVDTAAYRQMNPHRMIPTLQNGETVVWESHSIVRYLAQEYGPQLHGGTAAGMAQGSMWMDWVLHGSNFAPSFGSANHHLIDQVARTPPHQRDLAVVRDAHAEYVACLAKAEEELVSSGQSFLSGDEFSIADIPLATELNRWSLCVHAARRDGVELLVPPLPGLSRYYSRLLEREPFCKAVFSPEAQHQQLCPEKQPEIRELAC